MVESSHMSGLWPALYEPFRSVGKRLAEWVAPPAEATSAAGVYTITVELPGVAEDDIHLSVSEHVLTLQGEKREHREEQGEAYYFSERTYGAFSRSFRLPPDADGARVEADLKDGVLTIRVPRREAGPDEEPRRVEIRRA
jgi:HSP20 family protein